MNNPAQYGRNGDSTLVHMRPDELRGLQQLARAAGTDLTINPNTGYAEAWKLPSWVLPVAAVAATALTAGAAAPAAAGALGAAGAGTAAAGGAAAGTAAAGTAAAGAGAAGGGLLAAEGAGAAAAGSAGAGAGLLGAETAATGASAAGSGGLLATGEQASMLAAQNAGLEGATAATNAGLQSAGSAGIEQVAAPVSEMGSNASMFDNVNTGTNGLLGQASDAAGQYGKPVSTVLNASSQAQQSAPQQQPMQPPQRQNVPLDLSKILEQSQSMQQYDMQEQERRRQLMNKYVQGIGGI